MIVIMTPMTGVSFTCAQLAPQTESQVATLAGQPRGMCKLVGAKVLPFCYLYYATGCAAWFLINQHSHFAVPVKNRRDDRRSAFRNPCRVGLERPSDHGIMAVHPFCSLVIKTDRIRQSLCPPFKSGELKETNKGRVERLWGSVN